MHDRARHGRRCLASSRPLLTVVLGVALAGCGSSGPAHPSLAEDAKIAKIQVAINTNVLDGGKLSETVRGVDELISVCREKRDMIYEPAKGKRETVKQVLEDDANELRSSQRDLATKLEQAVSTNCT